MVSGKRKRTYHKEEDVSVASMPLVRLNTTVEVAAGGGRISRITEAQPYMLHI